MMNRYIKFCHKICGLLLFLCFYATTIAQNTIRPEDETCKTKDLDVVHKFYSKFITVDIRFNIQNPSSSSSVRLNNSIDFDQHRVRYNNNFKLLLDSTSPDDGYKYSLFTNPYGELIFSFVNPYTTSKTGGENVYYSLYSSRVKLKKGKNLIRLDFDYNTPLIWVTTKNDVKIAANETISVDSFKKIMGDAFGDEEGEGLFRVLDNSDKLIEQSPTPHSYDSSNGYVTTVVGTELAARNTNIQTEEEEDTFTIKRVVTDDDVFIKASMMDDEPDDVLPEEGNLYYIQNKKTKLILNSSVNDNVVTATLDTITAVSSQLWRIIDIGNGQVQLQNKGNGKVLEKGTVLNVKNTVTNEILQKWKLEPDAENFVSILNANVALENSESGVQHNDITENDEQKWTFVPFTGNISAPVAVIDSISVKAPYVVKGHAYDPDHGATTLEYSININNIDLLNQDNDIRKFKANLTRNDVNYAQHIFGDHGLEFGVPYQYFDGASHTIKVKAWDRAIDTLSTTSNSVSFQYNPCAISATALSAATNFSSLSYGKNRENNTIVALDGNQPVQWNGSEFVSIGSPIPNNFKSIDVDHEGNFWSIATDGNMYKNSIQTPNQWNLVNLTVNDSLAPTLPSLEKVACSSENEYGMLLLDATGNVYFYDGVSTKVEKLSSTTTSNTTITFKEVDLDNRGIIWAIGLDSNIYILDKDKKWVKVVDNANAKEISSGHDGAIFWLKNTGTIHKWDGDEGGYAVSHFNTGTTTGRTSFTVLNTDMIAVVNNGQVYANCGVNDLFEPSITSVYPVSGTVGSLVTIRGTHFKNVASVTIGTTPALVISKDEENLVAMVMPGTNGNNNTITVVTNAGSTQSEELFSVATNNVPNAQQGKSIVASDAVGTQPKQGATVAVSADGNTALVGGVNDATGKGAVWVYTKGGDSWMQETKLVATDTIAASKFGVSIAISADGNTAIVGGSENDSQKGAIWAFTRGYNSWSEGTKLTTTGLVASDQMGSSVSLSADGNTVIVGAPGVNNLSGAAFIFSRNQGIWSEVQSLSLGTLTSGTKAGNSVAVSADGKIAAVGAKEMTGGNGALWFFKKTGNLWSLLNHVSNVTATSAKLGTSLALNADGTVALVGASDDNSGKGSAWVYRRNATVFDFEKRILIGLENAWEAGTSVSLSADGNTAIIGAPGNATSTGGYYVFKNDSQNSWSIEGNKITGKIENYSDNLGTSVVISSDGSTLLAGAPQTNSEIGEALSFVYVGPPIINFIRPSSVPIGGLVEVIGEDLENIQTLSVNGTPAIIVSNDATSAKFMLMPGTTSGLITIATSRGSIVSTDNITIDAIKTPNVQLGDKLVANNIFANGLDEASQGSSIAISADGNTAIVGAPGYDSERGAVIFYSRSALGWTQTGSKLEGDNTGAQFGTAIALNADGTRVIVGAPGSGKVTIYTYDENNREWGEGQLLAVSNASANADLGSSVGLSADGKVAIVGGPKDSTNKGALWLFSYNISSNIWSQVSKLDEDDTTSYGESAVISADGKTIAVGVSTGLTAGQGVWTYNYDKTTQSVSLVEKIASKDVEGKFGSSLAISADGERVLVGAPEVSLPSYNDQAGKAWLFEKVSSSAWNSGTAISDSISSSNTYKFGSSVSLNANGKMAVIGSAGFKNNEMLAVGKASVFSFEGNPLSATYQGTLSGDDHIGVSAEGTAVTISADGNNVLVGGANDNDGLGAVWAYNGHPYMELLEDNQIDAEEAELIELHTYEGNVSAIKSFYVKATNLVSDIELRAPEGVELSTSATFSGGGKRYLKLSQNQNSYNGTVYVRVSDSGTMGVSDGSITVSADGLPTKSISLVYTVAEIKIDGAENKGKFATTYGSDATVQNIDVIGKNLVNEVMNVQATGEFEISTTGNVGDFSKNITLPKLGGEVYLRLATNLNVGSYTGKLIAKSNNLNLEELDLEGIVNKSPLVLTLTAQSKMGGQEWSAIKTFTVSNNITLTGFKKAEIFEEIDLNVGEGRLANALANTYTNSITYTNGKIIAGGVNVVNNYIVDVLQGNLSANLIVTPQPTITMPTGNLGAAGALNTTFGTAVASSNLSISILGSNLAGNITATAPNGYELSTSSNFTSANSTLILVKTGTSYSGNIYIRLKATTAVGTYSGNITFTSQGAITLSVPVLSNQVLPRPTITMSTGNLGVAGALNTTYGTAVGSSSLSITISGSNLVGNITATAPNGYELSTSSNFALANTTLSLTRSGSSYSGNIYIRLKATTHAGTYSGDITFSSSGAINLNIPVLNNVVAKAPLTVSISNVTKKVGVTWGESISHDNGITVTGFKNGETFAALDLTTSALVRPHNANPQYWDRCVWYNHYNNIAAYGRGNRAVLDDYYVANTGNPETIAGVTITRDGTDWYDNVYSPFPSQTENSVRVTLNYYASYLDLTRITEAWIDGYQLTIGSKSATSATFYVPYIPSSSYTYIGELILKNANGDRILNYNLSADYVVVYANRSMNIASRTANSEIFSDEVSIDKSVTTTEGLTVYPNPTANELNVSYVPKSTGEVVVSLWTMLGVEIANNKFMAIKEEAISHTLYLKDKNLSSGSYILKINNNEDLITRIIILK